MTSSSVRRLLPANWIDRPEAGQKSNKTDLIPSIYLLFGPDSGNIAVSTRFRCNESCLRDEQGARCLT